MPLAVAPGLLLLLLASGARGALMVSVPTSPVRAQPGSDLLLGCHFSVGGTVDMEVLVVQWKVGSRLVAEFDTTPSYPRAGASLSLEGLRVGNASLLLPRVGGADAGLYTCIVIHSPSRESRQVELRVEAPPRVSVSGTVVRAGKHSPVTCSVSGFYPGSVNVTWLRDKQVLGGSETPPAQLGPDGLYSTTSTLQLVPSISHADAKYSCHVQHVALGEPIQEPFRLSVLSRPSLTLQTVVTPAGLGALQVQVSGYYPPNITVEWLRDRGILHSMESLPTRAPDGSFTLRSSYILDRPEPDTRVAFTCRVQHPALPTPLAQSVTWKETDVISQDRTPNKGPEPSPTRVWMWLWLAMVPLLVVVLLCIGYWSYRISMSSIRAWECWPEGSVTALLCEAEGRLRDTDSLTWRSKRQGKELGAGQPGELNTLMPKLEQHRVVTWRRDLGLGRRRLTSVVTIQTPREDDTFSCTFQGARGMKQTHITIPGVPAGGPLLDGDMAIF
ncbi:tyrosine-protein phosphatase non-receptor type substrate 1-like isoform X1 [Chrysemys picta bellii]|uniref:tyrosine-protein phosphatase non-receptor type substrate 1-like isoform X1 n=1 Tax=Chrysemys picta bellii TaxID=8478 RepID=UPI0032B17B20